MNSHSETSYILTLSCQDVPGIVAAVAGFITQYSGFIIESAQFGDPSTGQFFARMFFRAGEKTPEEDRFKKAFHDEVGKPFAMDWDMQLHQRRKRVAIMVSKANHCLHELLYRFQNGTLPVEIPAIISNHPDLKSIADWYEIPFYHFPVTVDTKQEQEAQLLDVFERHDIDLVVLARYMQVLSPDLCERLKGRAINIHHSFLPSFKGAKPYHQAFDRGVKLIGATAHYVTTDLDEGPIIEQEVVRVDHTQSAKDLVSVGQDIEKLVLARAVRYHVESRVLLNDNKTVVFR